MTEQTIKQDLAEMYKRDMATIDQRKAHLKAVYNNAPEQIKNIAEAMDIEQSELITLCVQTAWHRDTSWLDVLDILDLFYTSKRRMDREKAEELEG